MSRWPQCPLGDLLSDATPGFACGEDVEDGLFQFRMNNITTEGQLELSKRRRVPKDHGNVERYIVQAGDVLFNATNSPDLVGKTAFFPGLEERATFSNHFLRLRPLAGRVDGRFLSRWLNLQFQRGRFKGMCRQWVNQATVGRDSLLAMRIELPPLTEQRRIAEILDKADALRAKRRAALAQLDTLTQSIFLDMFGDPATNPKGWPMRTLHELGAEFRYGTSVKSSSAGEPTLRIPNVVGGSIDLSDLKLVPVGEDEFERLRLRDGDLLFVRTNGNPDFVGRCAVFHSRDVGSSGHEADRFVYASYLIRARIANKLVEPVFLREFLLGAEGRRRLRARCKTSAGQYNINTEGLGAIAVPLPALGFQQVFAGRIRAVERIRAEHRAAIDQVDLLFAALQHRAFQGEL